MKASWTQLSILSGCSWQYHLRYMARIKKPQDPRPYLVGNVVHDSANDWAKAGYPEGTMPRIVEAHFRSKAKGLRFKSREALRTLYIRSLQGAVRVEKLFRQMGFPEHEVLVEDRFSVPVRGAPGHFLIGATDVYDPQVRGVFDIKMYSGDGTNRGDRRQLLTYAVAQRAQGRVVDKGSFVYPLRKEWLDHTPIVETEIDDHEDVIADMIGRVVRGFDPEPTPGPACHWCEYNRTPHCPATFKQGEVVESPTGAKRMLLTPPRPEEDLLSLPS